MEDQVFWKLVLFLILLQAVATGFAVWSEEEGTDVEYSILFK